MPWVTPRIDVTKVATPVSLPIGGGSVVYDYVISNPGSIPLSNVTLVDDKCSNITLLSGDINSNSKLEITESWKYSCAMNLSQTTTNIAIASGTADFTTVTDTANATVVVAVPVITVIPTPTVLIVSTTTAVVPLFPDAGLDPDPNFFPWNFLALLSVIFVSVLNLTKNKTTKPF